jgi:hypothetical protein
MGGQDVRKPEPIPDRHGSADSHQRTPDELRADAKKAAGAKGASGLYRRCANRVEKAINGDEPNEPVVEVIEPITEPAIDEPAAIVEPVAEPLIEEATEKATPLLDMARRRLALLG